MAGRRLTLGGPLLAAALLLSAPASASLLDREERLRLIEMALARWDVPAARWHSAILERRHEGDAEVLLAAARVAFHEADYETARDLAQRAAAGRDRGAARLAADMVTHLDTRESTWGSFEEHASEHFRLRVTARDRLLVPMALRALEQAAAALGADLGACPEVPIVVEVYPNRRSFIAATTLTREEIETSGTIAICHFNRIMILSPAVLSRGYDWLDTLCHEYVHHAVYRLGQDVIPVWMHEGIAKILEGRWRLPGPKPLEPRLSTLLAEGREAGEWVTFDEMHPSMAKLPSAELVGLAFAQVAKAMHLVVERQGVAGLRELVEAVRDHGGDVDRALRDVVGMGLPGFEATLKAAIAGAELRRIEGARLLSGRTRDPTLPVFRDDDAKALDPIEDARVLADRRARDWTILGDRLKGRQHHEAAVIQYGKALAQLGHSDPMVVNRQAHALVLAGRLDEALDVLGPVLADYPTLTTTLDNLAEVHVRLAARAANEAARDHLETALAKARRSESINPFNPDTHVRLAMILERLGRRLEAEHARERLRLVLAPY